MGHPTINPAEIVERNDRICRRVLQDPSVTNAKLANEFNLNRETIRGIRFRHLNKMQRNQRVADKFKGAFRR